ncbi:hypothetical protein PsYK624_115070 [Phanerochaete sordida]|uniref:Uncharacterized protein n=1 Tax=Phanerochaete sordida TaxID=48140 RepID=A0A9P3LHT2_9APHY|nr:hypothetical protein PsYK624_115070 [Phanerochaete sordida]
MRAGEQDRWTFSNNGIEGVNLLEAYERRLSNLDGADDKLLPADFVKVSIMIAPSGYAKYRRIKNVQRTRGGVFLPTSRRRVVEFVAEAVMLFLRQAKAAGDHTGAGNSIALGPGGIGLEDLYLVGLHRYGKTLLPILGYVPANTGPVFAPEIEWSVYSDLPGCEGLQSFSQVHACFDGVEGVPSLNATIQA